MGRDLTLEREWQERMRRFDQSGLNIQEFCKQEGLVYHQFTWWRRELKRRATKPAPSGNLKRKSKRSQPKKEGSQKESTATFVPVQVEPSKALQPVIEILLDQPPRIRVAPGFDAEVLRTVLRVLEQS